MKHKLTALLLTAGLVVAYAQRPGGPRGGFTPGEEGEMPPPAQALVEYLGLSDSQLESLAAIRDNTRDAAQPIVDRPRYSRAPRRHRRHSTAHLLAATGVSSVRVHRCSAGPEGQGGVSSPSAHSERNRPIPR